MRISDWSSDVCSSDLARRRAAACRFRKIRSRAGARLCRLSIRTSSSPKPTRQSPEAARKGLPALQERLRERCSVRELAEHRIHAAPPLAVEQRQLALGRGFAGLGHGDQGLEEDPLVGAVFYSGRESGRERGCPYV